MFAEHVRFLAENGCDGVCPNGSLGEYQTLSDEERGRVIETAVQASPAGFTVMAGAAAYGAARDRLIPIAQRESHLPRARLTGELGRTTFQLRLHADEIESGRPFDVRIDHADPAWGMGPRPDLRRVNVPLGPVVVFAASNFPFAFSVAGGDTSAALAAGCPVVLEAHPGHPRLSDATGDVVAAALHADGAPSGVFAVVHGDEAGRVALLDPRITAGAFTGSVRVGRILFDLAVSRPVPIPFFGDLGSVNPVFVTRAAAAARAEAIVDGFIGSYTLGAGQFCTKPGLLFVPADSEIPRILTERQQAGAYPAQPLLNERIRAGFDATLTTLQAHDGVEPLVAAAEGRRESRVPSCWSRPSPPYSPTRNPFWRNASVRARSSSPTTTRLNYWTSRTCCRGSSPPSSSDRTTMRSPRSWWRPQPSMPAACCGTSGPPASASPTPSSTVAPTPRRPRPRRPRSGLQRSVGSCAPSPIKASCRPCCPLCSGTPDQPERPPGRPRDLHRSDARNMGMG